MTYLYRFDWQSPAMGGKLKSLHTLKIPFVFDNTRIMAGMTGATEEAAAQAARLSDAWIAFATSGNPNAPKMGLPHWAPYTANERPTMLLNTESRLVADPEKEERRLNRGIANPYISY